VNIFKFVFLMMASWGCFAADAPKEKFVVNLAYVGPNSGSDIAVDSLNGVKMALTDGNNLGIVVDNKTVVFQLLVKDDDGDKTIAMDVAKRIVMGGKVKAVIGHLSSSTSVYVSQTYAKSKIIQISPGATNPLLTKGQSETTFRVISNDEQQAKSIADFVMNKLGSKRVVLLSEKNGYADGISEILEDEFNKKNVGFKAKVQTTKSPMDVLYNVPKLMAANAETIVMVGLNPVFIPYGKALRKAGFKGKMVLTDGSCTDEFLEGVTAEGEYFCSRNGAAIENMTLWPAFYDRFKADYGYAPGVYAGYAYDAAKAFILSLKSSGSVDTVEIAKAMHKADYMGITGQVSFERNGDRKNAPVSIYEANNGGWLLEAAYPLPPGEVQKQR
jgi:branched-chain amino acid transport system substrate-binding protein